MIDKILKETDDKELYQNFLQGNQESFNILVKKYRKQLLSFIVKYIGDIEASEDIVQDVFIYVFVTKKEYTFKYTFKTYLYTIAKSRIINYKKQKKLLLPLDEDINFDNIEIDDILIKQEEKDQLLKIIDSLKEEYKKVIYLRELEGYSYKEICEDMNKSLAQVKMLLYRARKVLKRKMKKNMEHTHLKVKVFINTILIILCITGFTYAGITLYELVQKETKTDFKNNPEYDDYNEDMSYFDGVYYKIISTYQNYLDDQKKWTDLVEMTKDDFDEYFVVVIAGENYDTTGVYISDITADEEHLYIDLEKKEKWDGSTVISTKIQKELYRDSIIIRNNPNIPNTSDKFISMEEIPIGYSKEQAIKDGCFVIEYGEIISDDKNQLENFIKNANDGIDGFIRIYQFDIIENITVIDIECKNKKINMSQCNKTSAGNYIIYNSGNSITKSDNNIYWLMDELGNKKVICSTNK